MRLDLIEGVRSHIAACCAEAGTPAPHFTDTQIWGALLLEGFDPAEHPRGQPDNAGEFVAKGAGGGGKKEKPVPAKPTASDEEHNDKVFADYLRRLHRSDFVHKGRVLQQHCAKRPGDPDCAKSKALWDEVAKERGVTLPVAAPKKKAPAPKKDELPASAHPGAAHGAKVKVTPTEQRAAPRDAKGKIVPVPIKTQLTPQETGRIGEASVHAYLRTFAGLKDTIALNADKKGQSIDLFGDSMAPEVKTGLCSNSVKAQQWRITFSIDLDSKAGREFKALKPDQQKAWREKKQRAALKRKLTLLKKLSQEHGKEIQPVTITGIVNPDIKTIDIYKFSGYHQRLDWNSPEAQKAYVGSFKYEHAGE
jgi:hypothetical protein